MKALHVLSLSALLLLPLHSQAAIITQDNFDGAPGTLAGQGGGIGWGNNWTAFSGAYTVLAGNLSFAANSALTASGNKVTGGAASVGFLYRVPAAPINLTTDATYFLTYVVTWSPGTFTNVAEENPHAFQFGITSAGVPQVQIDAGAQVNGTGAALTTGEAYQLVARLDTFANGATPDVLSMKAYKVSGVGAEALPTSAPTTGWDVTTSYASNLSTGSPWIYGLQIGNNAQIDGFTVATQWSDIANVPEPTSLALLALSGVAGAFLYRRSRSRKNA